MSKIRKEDIIDAEIVDADELISDATLVYFATITIVSTTTGTNIIVVSGFTFNNPDVQVEAGDLIQITGSAAAGTYTINSIINSTTIDVVESIVTSTGGTADLLYDSGSLRVGFNPAGLTAVSATDVQNAIQQLATSIGSTTLNYDLLLSVDPPRPDNNYSNIKTNNNITQETWKRTDLTNLKRIDYTYTSNKVTTEVIRVYAANGSTVVAQLTSTMTYSGNTVTAIASVRNI